MPVLANMSRYLSASNIKMNRHLDNWEKGIDADNEEARHALEWRQNQPWAEALLAHALQDTVPAEWKQVNKALVGSSNTHTLPHPLPKADAPASVCVSQP